MTARPTEPDDLAFWRGLVVGGCISTGVWIIAGGSVWAALKGAF